MANKVEYYKVKPERTEWLGVRFFKVDWDSIKAIQVCVGTGDVKRGKANAVGIYTIDKVTFCTNYLGMGYVTPCTKREFEKKFDLIVSALK